MSNSEQDRTLDELEIELADTRQQVARDVAAVVDKVSPENVKLEARRAGKRALFRMGHGAEERVKAAGDSVIRGAARAGAFAMTHPVVCALGAMGLTLALYATWSRRRVSPRGRLADWRRATATWALY